MLSDKDLVVAEDGVLKYPHLPQILAGACREETPIMPVDIRGSWEEGRLSENHGAVLLPRDTAESGASLSDREHRSLGSQCHVGSWSLGAHSEGD